jgi:glyoxylase-like metal-dependent hydrolase (beta-lactamase superfamily II)
MRVFAMTCGWITAPLEMFLTGEPGSIRVPVPSFLIEHPKGLVLFDAGIHPSLRRDPRARLGALADIYRVEMPEGEDVAAQLETAGIAPERIDFLIASHLHFDHVGGNECIPNARVVVQRREWEAGRDADLQRRNGYDPRDYDLGHDVLCIDGEYDLFGDGRITCLPTPGHTPGHQSLRLRSDAGDVVLAADTCYLRRTLERLHLPPVVYDPAQMTASLERLRRLEAAGARIFPGHDPEFWATLPHAPSAVVSA